MYIFKIQASPNLDEIHSIFIKFATIKIQLKILQRTIRFNNSDLTDFENNNIIQDIFYAKKKTLIKKYFVVY